MKKIVIITLLTALCLFAQVPQLSYFAALSGAVVLAGAGTTVTVQQPATNGEQITLTLANVTCPAACTITQTQNATGVTGSSGTAGTVVGIDPTPGATFALTFWTAVTLSGGTVIGHTVCSAACTVPLDLTTSAIKFGNTGINTNYSLTISSVTGTAYLEIYGTRQ